MITGARYDWPQHLRYKTCVSKFHNSERDVEEVQGSVRYDLAFINSPKVHLSQKKKKIK